MARHYRPRRPAGEIAGKHEARTDQPCDERKVAIGVLLIAEAYGAWGEKKNYGKVYVGLIRSTFVIGADGKIIEAMNNVKATGHAAKVAEKLG